MNDREAFDWNFYGSVSGPPAGMRVTQEAIDAWDWFQKGVAHARQTKINERGGVTSTCQLEGGCDSAPNPCVAVSTPTSFAHARQQSGDWRQKELSYVVEEAKRIRLMKCKTCGKNEPRKFCPLPVYDCACKGDYCRLLGFDTERFCSKECADGSGPIKAPE